MNIKRGKLNKKAQFYIIAAIIIISVLVGIAALTNYAKIKKDYTKIYDLGEELGIETGYVYDRGIYQEEDLNVLLDNWTDAYLDYTKGQDVIEDWIFVYGNEEEMTAAIFIVEEVGTVGVYIGGENIQVPVEIKTTRKKPLWSVNQKIEVTFRDFNYEFNLEKGENFFFIITSGNYSAIPAEPSG